MKRFALLICLAAATASAASPIERFGWFAELAGSCWSGTFPDGVTRHEHCYSTQFDRVMRGTATLSVLRKGTFVEQFAGDSVYA